MHSRYDYFKAELLKTKYFDDNIYCHFTASFAAGTVATTVCSPADVIKVGYSSSVYNDPFTIYLPH